jgi:probable F420-dependent oxidoreductase
VDDRGYAPFRQKTHGVENMDFGALMFFTDYAISAVDLAKALEERGFESVWAPEHSHIPVSRKTPFPGGGELPKRYYDAMDPFVSLTAAAIATTRLKLGTGVCLVQQRDPIQTAKLVASVDQVSNGRFLFGVGGGWNADEMENHGSDPKTRFKLMRERIEAMKELWTQSKAEYHGDMVNFDPVMAWPKAGAKTASADPGRRRLAAGGAACNPLWRRLVPDRRPAGVEPARRPRPVSPDGARFRARPQLIAGDPVQSR